MQIGKASYNVLKRSVIKPAKEGVLTPSLAGIGVDGSVFSMEKDGVFVMSSNPVMIAGEDGCFWGVQRCLADIYSAGGTPVGIQNTVILPADVEEKVLQNWMKRLKKICMEADILLLGGHTTVSKAASEMIVTLSAVGSVKKEPVCPQAGWDILITRSIGIAGTALLAKEKESELSGHYTRDFIAGAKDMKSQGMTTEEAKIGTRYGAAMHNLSEGGVLAGLWELLERGNLGMEADQKKIPVRQETVELTEYFGINPYQMFSVGSYLMAAEDGASLAAELERAGIPAAIIGKTTAGKSRILYRDDEVRYLDRPAPDELYKVGLMY